MASTPARIILASSSPRRRELLTQIGVTYKALAVDVSEAPHPGETPEHYVQRVAAEKSQMGMDLSNDGLPVLGADTEVVLDGEVLGKPRNFGQAARMLSRLSGREHRVLSAVSLRHGSHHWQALQTSLVTFRSIGADEMAAYWASGEPADKAGAYGIQGIGAVFVRHLAGSFSGVMGLPLFETAELLRNVGIVVLEAQTAADER